MADDPPASRRLERRRAPRLQLPPRGAAISVLGARLLNISRYGMLIESPVPLARDAVLELRVTIQGEPSDVRARVAVCTAQPGLRVYGVGLEFEALDPRTRERLERALE